MNLRPSGYEPDELPDCSTPRQLSTIVVCNSMNPITMALRITKLVCNTCDWKTRRRPTLPCLKTKYHRRYRLSRPSSEWDRVGHLCHNHLVIQTHIRMTSYILGCTRHRKHAAEAKNTEDIQNLSVSLHIPYRADVCLYARLIKPIERLVPISFTHYCASTLGLSTWWSSTVLKRILVSRGASRLDAFSGYPVHT